MRRTLLAASLSLAALAAAPAAAHPLAPALLVLAEEEAGVWSVTWKTPRRSALDPDLAPVLPTACTSASPARETRLAGGRELHWSVACDRGLVGERVAVRGLDGPTRNALLRIEPLFGPLASHLLDAHAPGVVVEGPPGAARVARTYLGLGVGHLAGGLDHVLFVVVLTLLVGWGRRLVWTVTLFTVGHSVTLGLAALGFVRPVADVVEPLIAFSIVLAAAELARPDPRSRLRRAPWAFAGAFGLLHGMGFAGALSEVGLPAGEIPLALAAFNVGIEVGQLAVVGATLAATALLRHLPRELVPPLVGSQRLAGTLLGAVAATWFWQRLPVFPGLG